MNTSCYIVGCGGIGGHLLTALFPLLTYDDHLILVDGDKVEEKNLDRQFFSRQQLDTYKVIAHQQILRRRHPSGGPAITTCARYLDNQFRFRQIDLDEPTDIWILCGADNHTARRMCLVLADTAIDIPGRVTVVIGANHTVSAEAYLYRNQWSFGPLDPRTFYPEINTSEDPHDPLAPCTGDEALEETPQLVFANMSAAVCMIKLFYLWKTEDPQEIENYPFMFSMTPSAMTRRLVKDVAPTLPNTNQGEDLL